MLILQSVTSFIIAAVFGACALIFMILGIAKKKAVWWILAAVLALPMLFMAADGVMLLTGGTGLIDLLF